MVHLSDLDWKLPGEQVIDNFKKGDMVKAVVLDVDVEKERISLGVKQLEGDPFAEPGDVKKGAVVTCEVLEVKEGGIEVKIAGTDFTTFIKRSELARDRNDQRAERFAVGEKVDARVIQFDKKARKVQVSIKALEVAEEKEAIAQYGSSDSGATLGDILGTALKQRTRQVSFALLVFINRAPVSTGAFLSAECRRSCPRRSPRQGPCFLHIASQLM